MDGVAQAGGILWNQDVVYTEQGPDWAEGAAEAGAGLFKGVFAAFGEGVVGI